MTERNSYIVDRVLHWCSAFLVIYMLLAMADAIHTTRQALDFKQAAIEYHLGQALVVILLLMARLAWAKIGPPRYSNAKYKNKLHENIVRVLHSALYLTLFLLPVTGVLMVMSGKMPISVLGIYTIVPSADHAFYLQAQQFHHLLIDTLYYLIAMHFVGAMYNYR